MKLLILTGGVTAVLETRILMSLMASKRDADIAESSRYEMRAIYGGGGGYVQIDVHLQIANIPPTASSPPLRKARDGDREGQGYMHGSREVDTEPQRR